MIKIDPEWVRHFVPRSGLSVAEFSIEPLEADPESPAIRQRRYPRLRLEQHVTATTTNLKENCQLDIPELALGGGVAFSEQSLHPGSIVTLRLVTSQKPVKVQAIVRDANTQARAFEVVDMELEERAKLRKLLVQLGSVLKASTSKERNRRTTRTISTARSSASSSASQLDPALLEASNSLGANSWMTFRRVTLPQIAPGVAAASLRSRRSDAQAIDSRKRRGHGASDQKNRHRRARPSHRSQCYRGRQQSDRVARERDRSGTPTPRQQSVVRNYLFKIFDKLGVSTRVELVLYCLQERPQPGQLAS